MEQKVKRFKCNIEICQTSTICNTRNAKDFNANNGEFYYELKGIISIENGNIEVSYDDEDGDNFKYIGNEIAIGHWILNRIDSQETASLHSFPKSKMFVGCWDSKDPNEHGFWRIQAKEEIG